MFIDLLSVKKKKKKNRKNRASTKNMSLSRVSDGFGTLHTDLDLIFSFPLCRLVGKHGKDVQRFP